VQNVNSFCVEKEKDQKSDNKDQKSDSKDQKSDTKENKNDVKAEPAKDNKEDEEEKKKLAEAKKAEEDKKLQEKIEKKNQVLKQMEECEAAFKKSGDVVKDRKYFLSTYPKCFVGSELIDWFVKIKTVKTREEGLALGQKLYDADRIHQVSYENKFKDDKTWFRFESDEPEKKDKGPSVQKLCQQENVLKREVSLKGSWGYNKVWAVLSREEKKLYFFDKETSHTPQKGKTIDLTKCKHNVTECNQCKSGAYCIKLIDACEQNTSILCSETPEDQAAWLHGLVQAGVVSSEDEQDATDAKAGKMPTSFYEFTAYDIDGKQVKFDKYKGQVCLVVNVASF